MDLDFHVGDRPFATGLVVRGDPRRGWSMRAAAIAGLLVLLAADRPSASRLADARGIRERLGLSPAFDAQPGVGAIKIAVLDYGFDGADQGRGYLPEGTVIVEHYDP